MATIDKRPLKAFVKYVKGKIVAGSLILRRKMPANYGGAIWVEIPAYRCCEPVNPNCIEYSITVGSETVNVSYVDCDGADQTLQIVGPTVYTLCARRDSISTDGSPDVAYIGLCSNSTSTTSTSTTSTSSTTTTTTTVEPTTTTTTTTGG